MTGVFGFRFLFPLDDEIPYGDEIRLDGGRVDLISSAKQISSEHRSDFIALRAISLKIIEICDIKYPKR